LNVTYQLHLKSALKVTQQLDTSHVDSEGTQRRTRSNDTTFKYHVSSFKRNTGRSVGPGGGVVFNVEIFLQVLRILDEAMCIAHAGSPWMSIDSTRASPAYSSLL
jgi:UDP-N-acetylenolpyruvoylglucosamine reductase